MGAARDGSHRVPAWGGVGDDSLSDSPLRDVHAGRGDRWALLETGPTAYPPGRLGRTLKDTPQRGREGRDRFGQAQRIAQLATDLVLADDAGVKGRGNPHPAQQRRATR